MAQNVPELPDEVVAAVKILGAWAELNGLREFSWLTRGGRLIGIGDQRDDGEPWQLFFNREYEVDADEAIILAMVLLGFAHERGLLSPRS